MTVIDSIDNQYRAYLKESTDALDYLHGRGFTDETLDTFNIGFAPLGDKRFGGRVMFPVYSYSGKLCGFSGRLLVSSNQPKYRNSPESEDFKKTHMLFGMKQHKKNIFIQNKAIIVEGFTDVMAFHQAGYPIAVASMGTALTDDQLRLIGRLTSNIYLCMDNDEAGYAAQVKAEGKARKLGFTVGKIALPKGQDPADYLLTK